MNYCHNCGNKIEDKFKFCSNCGIEISSDISESYPTEENLINKTLHQSQFDKDSDFLVESNVISSNSGSSLNNDFKRSVLSNSRKKYIFSIVTVLLLIVSAVTLNIVSMPKLKGSDFIQIEKFEEYIDQGLTYNGIYQPIVSITGLPDTSEPGEYIITYRFKNIFGYDAPPIYRRVIIQDVDPLRGYYNYLITVESYDVSNSNNITCNIIEENCVIDNLDGPDMRVYLEFSPNEDVFLMNIFPYIGTFYNQIYSAEINIKDGFMYVSDCATWQLNDPQGNNCSVYKYNYLYEYYERYGFFKNFPADDVGPILIDVLDLLLFSVDSSVDDLYRYYN